jgi:transposase
MNNASFHRKKFLEIISKIYNFKLLFLPPYSPNKNPIELWANMKRWLKANAKKFETIQSSIYGFFNFRKLRV